MTAAASAAFVFLALLFLIVALYQWTAERGSPERRLRGLRSARQSPGANRRGLPLRRGLSSIPALRQRLANRAWAQRTSLSLARAGLNLTVGEYLLLRVLLGTAGLVVPVVVSGAALAGLIAGLALGASGVIAPAVYVRLRERRRRAVHAVD